MLLFLCLGIVSYLDGQHLSEQQHVILKGLEKQLQKGNKRSLRDLGSMLNGHSLDKQVREIIGHYTLFTEHEIDVKTVNKAEFLFFFYEYQSQIRFSELFGAFYITPIEERQHEFRFSKVNIQDLEQIGEQTQDYIDAYIIAFQEKNVAQIVEMIEQMSSLGTQTASSFLESQLLNKTIPSVLSENDSKNIYLSLIQAVANRPSYRSLKFIMGLLEAGKISFKDVHYSMSRFTNIPLMANEQPTNFSRQFTELSDSLFTLAAIQSYGYDQLLPFRSIYFFEQVDYYGKIYCRKNHYRWLSENAYRDMLATKHPRTLLYLAAYIFKNRKVREHPDYHTAVEMMEKLTKIPITFSSPTAYQDFLFYWWQSYNEYEWNKTTNCFVNKAERIERLETYENLYRRLNSKNDEAAMEAYLGLIQGRPQEVIELLQKYRSLLRSINKKLPNIKLGFIEQLVLLHDFCQKNHVETDLSAPLVSQVEKLLNTTRQPERYKLELDILSTVTFEQLTALEIWGVLHTKDRPTNMSISRIVDMFYSFHWDEVLARDKQLRLFLKKAQLFKAIGASGTCNSYLNKINFSNSFLQKRLEELALVETDTGIKNQIAQILTNQNQEGYQSRESVSNFIATPLKFNSVELQILPKPSIDEIEKICKNIKSTDNIASIKKYFTYLSLHPSIEAVPALFTLINEKNVLVQSKENKLTVGQRIVPILEDVYDYTFTGEAEQVYATKDWIQLWKKQRKNYANWGDMFLTERLDSLKIKETLSIEELNEFMEQAAYKPKFVQNSLELLDKIQPIKNIRRLNLDKKLNPVTDLVHFKNLGFTHKQLDDIPKLFEINDAAVMLDFLEAEAVVFEDLDRAAFYNNLFNQRWFLEHILTGTISSSRIEHFAEALQFYLDESDYLSEYEEQSILLNLTNLNSIGKPVSVKLESSLALDADDKLKANIQQDIIAHISYEEIGVVAQYIPYLSKIHGQNTFDFLNKDFGLPIFELDSLALNNLIQNHQQMTEAELYQHYLLDFGVDFMTDKQLDFEKIYRILQYDIVSPLTGTGGSIRDYFVYGLIKILELHFETRLGFHEKLNESQTFYTFTSTKRAKAWLDYLEEQALIDLEAKLAPSFNRNPDIRLSDYYTQ